MQPLLLKGAALARTLYRSDETRGYFDIDLLVSPDAVGAAGRVLHGLGYRNVTALQGVEGVAGSVHAEMWSALLPDFGNLTVDLHWRLDGCEVQAETAWSVLDAEHAIIELAGRDVRTLSRPGLALHLALHAAQHGREDLKAIADLSRGIERWPPEIWGRAAGLARELAATEAFGAGLRLVPEGELIARQLGLPSGAGVLWELEHRGTRPRGTFHLRAFSEAHSWRERLTLLRRSLVPTRAWIVWEHPDAATSPLRLIAAYGRHLVRAPGWAVRAWLFSRRRPKA